MTYEELKELVGTRDIGIHWLEEEDNRGVHNFSLPTLQSYFCIGDMLAHKRPPMFIEGSILFLPSKQGRYKTFCYQPLKEEHKDLLEKMRTMGPIYSIYPISFLKGELKFKEVGYNLRDVFDPSKYPNAKKRYQKIVYPFKHIEKNNIRRDIATPDEVKTLHDEWAEKKMADPNTFRMMFPNKRYWNCFLEARKYPHLHKTYTFYIGEKLIAVRILGVQDKRVFDLANFGRFWDSPSQTMNVLDTIVLKDLLDYGFEEFNCGAGLNKNLTMFKEHYPSFDIISYQYSKTK